ncbi:hypothetical protein [Vibrio campbellii]|uniref:hypothetical protein n=1 Tax=Vibrio campbellii TaxID=680 RepID=UPI00210A143C|nr:hypothetical protein [Vibrio campbellii]UTZ44840.1 hypothetical protein HB764_26660 [Vibrio campbellii]
MLGFFVSRLSILDSAVKAGDVIRFKTDYGKGNKTLNFTKPVVIGDQLFVDGEVSVNQELELYFNGVTWQDSCFSSAPFLDVGVLEISTSKTVTQAEFVNTAFEKPMLLIIEVVGGCGGSRFHSSNGSASGSQRGAGGGGAGYGAIEVVVFPDDIFPKIDFVAGASGLRDTTYKSKDATDGTASTLSMNDLLVLECRGGLKGEWGNDSIAAKGSDAIYHANFATIYHETVKGNDSPIPHTFSDEIVCKYRTIAPDYSNSMECGDVAIQR